MWRRANLVTPVVRRKRHPYARVQFTDFQIPDLVEIQRNSFNKFREEGIGQTFAEISPIEDYTGSYAVEFGEHRFEEPPVSVEECMSKDKTYAAPLFVRVRFIVKETGEVREQDVFMGDFPLMTGSGTFVINGTERVVVTQLVRSPGAYIMEPKDPTDRKSTRLNSSHANISYAVFCLKKKRPSRGPVLDLRSGPEGS